MAQEILSIKLSSGREEQEPLRLDLPDADVFLKNFEDYIDKVNVKCLEIISERLGITKEEAEELAEKLQDEAWADYMKEQAGKLRFLCTK